MWLQIYSSEWILEPPLHRYVLWPFPKSSPSPQYILYVFSLNRVLTPPPPQTVLEQLWCICLGWTTVGSLFHAAHTCWAGQLVQNHASIVVQYIITHLRDKKKKISLGYCVVCNKLEILNYSVIFGAAAAIPWQAVLAQQPITSVVKRLYILNNYFLKTNK